MSEIWLNLDLKSSKLLLDLCVREFRGVSRARVTTLHFPSMHYLDLFIGRCLTAKQESGTLGATDLIVLCSTLYGDMIYNLGEVIALRLSKNRTKGTIYGGVYATPLIAHLNVPIRHDKNLSYLIAT